MGNINYTPQDILHKQFKERSIGKGYDMADVDEFLDNVIKDYDTYNKEIDRLNDENERLKAKVDELNRQVEVGATMNTRSANQQPVSNATNMDILKRLSNLERRVFGSQPGDNNGNDDSHLL